MSAECFKHGCDLVYGGDGMASVCQLCEREDELALVRTERDRYCEALEKIYRHGDHLDCVIEAQLALYPKQQDADR